MKEDEVIEPIETEPVVEAKDTRAHILSPDELEAWKNGTDEGPVLRRAADVAKDEDSDTSPQDETNANDEPKDGEIDDDSEEDQVTPDPFALQVTDPGPFQPKDYSFELVVFDDDGKNPKTIKIASVEQWDQLLETDPNLGSGSAVLKAQRQATRMETGIERDQESWQTKKQAYDEAKAVNDQQTQTLTQWDNELDYLSSKGKLPQISKELKEANWNDPEISAQGPVKARIDLMKYMDRESKARQKLGLSKFTSVLDAYNSYVLDRSETEQVAARRQAAESRKAASARVGGSQPAQATNTPKGIAVGRVSPGGLRDMGSRF